jgi:molecular chaperone DnaK (HSP70)
VKNTPKKLGGKLWNLKQKRWRWKSKGVPMTNNEMALMLAASRIELDILRKQFAAAEKMRELYEQRTDNYELQNKINSLIDPWAKSLTEQDVQELQNIASEILSIANQTDDKESFLLEKLAKRIKDLL